MFKIGEFQYSVQDPLMNSHWLSKTKTDQGQKIKQTNSTCIFNVHEI